MWLRKYLMAGAYAEAALLSCHGIFPSTADEGPRQPKDGQ